MLEASLRVRRGTFLLEAELRLEHGVTALFGPSGSGKTTLLHALAGLVRADSARIVLDGRVLDDARTGVRVPPHRRGVGIVFQDLRLFPDRSVRDNLLYGWRRVRPGRRRLPLSEVVEVLELSPLLRRRPAELSGGERQRVALGRALLAGPDLLLLDEPLAALDERLRRQILPYVRWVHESQGVPLIYVSHALPEILDLTDRMLVLRDGRVAAHGEVFDVLAKATVDPRDRSFSTESLLRVVVVRPHEEGDYVEARVGDQTLFLPFAPRSPGAVGRVAVRPEDVVLATSRLRGVSARNQLRGRVARISGLHGRLLVHVTLAEEAVVRAEVTEEARRELGLEVGSEVHCLIKTSAFRWL